jgi:glycosyltransferase involved in cell wall biosynthesis
MISVRGMTRFDNSRASHYRGVRYLVLGREIVYLPFTIVGLLLAKKRWKHVDLIHVNEITEIIPGLLAKFLFKAPLIVHVRSMMWSNERSLRVKWLRAMLKRHADALVAIDENVKESIGPELPVTVIHNSFDSENMPDVGVNTPPRDIHIPDGTFVVGFVGNLHLSKGVFELLQAARIVRDLGCDVHYLMVGSSQRNDSGLLWSMLNFLGLAQEQQTAFMKMMNALNMQDRFHFAGHTSNVARYIKAMDVLAFPSHFDACGRPVFEAAFYARPSIAAVSRPKADTLQHGVTGLAIAAPDPRMLADAIIEMASQPERTRAMGEAAKLLAQKHFLPSIAAQQLGNLYSQITGKPL